MVRRRVGRYMQKTLRFTIKRALGNWMVLLAKICRVCVPSFVDVFRGLFRSTPKCNESFRGCLQFLGHGKGVK